jgi:hypothetical protein
MWRRHVSPVKCQVHLVLGTRLAHDLVSACKDPPSMDEADGKLSKVNLVLTPTYQKGLWEYRDRAFWREEGSEFDQACGGTDIWGHVWTWPEEGTVSTYGAWWESGRGATWASCLALCKTHACIIS